MKLKFLLIVSFLILLFIYNVSMGTDFSNRQMKIVVNSHEHFVKDFISDTLNKAWEEERDSILSKIRDTLTIRYKVDKINRLYAPSTITKISFYSSTNKLTGKINIQLKGWEWDFDNGSNNYNMKFDIIIGADFKKFIDYPYYKLKFYNVYAKVVNFKPNVEVDLGWSEWVLNFFTLFLYQAYEEVYESWVELIIKFITELGFMDSYITKYLRERTTPITLFSVDKLPGTIRDPNAVEDALNSFPIDLKFDKYGNSDSNLVIILDFMNGTESNPESFVGIQPDPVPDNTLDRIGFGCQYESFLYAFRGWSCDPGSELSRALKILDDMENLGIPTVRLEVPWREVVGNIPSDRVNCGLNPEMVTDELIDSLVQNGNWEVFDQILDAAIERKMDLIFFIGYGSTSHTPLVEGLSMAPSKTPLPANSGGMYYVDEDTYLYYLKLFAHAAVRRYRNKVPVWMIEGELNAARFAYLFGWWREGNSWADDSPGGFNDRVWDILVEAVRSEDPSAKLTSEFHMLNLVKALQRYGPDLDIIGVNFYPNQLFAYPVMGFMVGEMVWATRRALKGLDIEDKPVYITETNYPALEEADPPSDISIGEDLMYFSYSRQCEYLRDAIKSVLEYGGKGFFWFSLWLSDTPSTLEPYTPFGGFYKYNSLELKPAANVFKTKIQTSYPGKCSVYLTNRSLATGENIGGKISLAGELDSLNSGAIVYAIKERTHLSRTDQEYIGSLRHRKWNNEEEYKLAEDFEVKSEHDYLQRDAYFDNQITVNFVTSPSVVPLTETIKIGDPYIVDPSKGDRRELNNIIYKKLSSSQYKVFLNQNEEFSDKYPIYHLRAPIAYATTSDIYVFDHWEASGAVFDENGATTTINRETPVVFKNSGATVTAYYVSALQPPGKLITIDDGEEVIIPAGGEYNIMPDANGNSNFGFCVNNGSLLIKGTGESPVIFQVVDASGSDRWNGIQMHEANAVVELRNVIIKNSRGGLSLFSIYVNSGSLTMDSCRIEELPSSVISAIKIFPGADAEISHTLVEGNWLSGSVGIDCQLENGYSTVRIVNNTIVNFDKGIKANLSGANPSLDIRNNIIDYNNTNSGTIGIDVSYTTLSNTSFQYNLINGYSQSGLENIPYVYKKGCKYDEDPLFNNPANGDFTLQSSASPAHDAGDPDSQYNDPDSTRNDMGAYYYDPIPGSPYLKSIVWTGGHPKIIWTHPADKDIEKFVLAKTYKNSSGTGTWYVDVYGDTFYIDTDIDYINPRFANTTATYKVKSVDWIGQESGYSNSKSVSGNGPLWKQVVDIPKEFRLHEPFPNPFNSTVVIRYDLPEESHVEIKIYDIRGNLIRALNDKKEDAGYKSVCWDGTDNRGKLVSSGIYVMTFRTEKHNKVKKIVLVR